MEFASRLARLYFLDNSIRRALALRGHVLLACDNRPFSCCECNECANRSFGRWLRRYVARKDFGIFVTLDMILRQAATIEGLISMARSFGQMHRVTRTSLNGSSITRPSNIFNVAVASTGLELAILTRLLDFSSVLSSLPGDFVESRHSLTLVHGSELGFATKFHDFF